MTYCLGWKTDNYAYLIADAAVLSSRPLIEEHSSFGELHVQFEDKNIQEGAPKIFPIGDAALTFAGDARNGYSILHNLRTALDSDQPYRRAFQSAIDSNTPFSEGRSVALLFTYFESGEPKLTSFNAQNDLRFTEHSPGELVQIGVASHNAFLSGFSEAVIEQMRAQVREGSQLLSCILGFCQHFGIHNHLIELGAGGTFAGCLVCSGGFFWQPDIFYLVGDLSHARPEVPETTVFVTVREGVLAVRSTLSPGRHRLFTTRRPAETVEHFEERCGMADRATLESLKGRCFDFITVLDTRFPVVGLIGMNRKQAHRDIVIGQWVQTDGLELLQISFSPELWAQLHDSYQSLKELRPAEGYDLGFLFHYRPYRNPEFSVSHVSFEVEFYHDQDDSKPVILPEVLDAYRSAKDTANIFIQNRDGQNFSADHLLGWWLKHKDKELRDCVPESVKRPEGASETVPFEINFSPNSFHMLTNQGPLDIKRLTLFVRFTWVPTSATPRPT